MCVIQGNPCCGKCDCTWSSLESTGKEGSAEGREQEGGGDFGQATHEGEEVLVHAPESEMKGVDVEKKAVNISCEEMDSSLQQQWEVEEALEDVLLSVVAMCRQRAGSNGAELGQETGETGECKELRTLNQKN
jgi:hypothetical protein